VQPSQRITRLGAPITKDGGAITILRRVEPRHSTLVAQRRHGLAVVTRPLARDGTPVMGGRVATGRELIVSSVLILVRTSLVTLARRLVVIRPRLILIARRLIVI
jgi:hypothetical protein